MGSSSGTRDALKAKGLNGPPEKALIEVANKEFFDALMAERASCLTNII